MASANRMNQLIELDRLVNDPNVLMDAARVWDLLDELSGQVGDMTADLAGAQAGTAKPARAA
jgi:hypothetical protein